MGGESAARFRANLAIVSAELSSSVPSYLIFGGSGGIGSALARRLLASGAQVFAAGRSSARLEAAGLSAHCPFLPCDVRSTEQVDAAFAAAMQRCDGTLHGVALCVGSIVLRPVHLTSDADFAEVLDLNLGSAFRVARAAAKTLRDGGAVVFCSSAAASVGMPNHEAIAAAKAGIEGLVRSAAATYAARGLRFSAVAPGLVRTPLAAAITGNAAALAASESLHPLGRIGEPADVAAAIGWLLDPANSWLSGEVLHVDGGLSRLRAAPRR
jgi:NAD(P)-dependent dehydrogenase (short-subunit alcohol dehydrogenase family)